jgi:hypothetical protein
MKEDCARSILRLIAVVTILIGVSGATATIVYWLGSTISKPDFPATLEIYLYAVLWWVVIAAWGFALYRLSPWLARRVVA